MKIYEFRREQILNTDLENAWRFFSNPQNLNNITPPSLRFKIISQLTERMFSGQIITYRIRILPFIFQQWVTEIKEVEELKFFIDEQRFGPY